MDAPSRAIAGVTEAAEAYARALHESDTETLRALFHADSHLYAVGADGGAIDWPRETFLDRVGSRPPGEGAAEYRIEQVDVAGPEMAWTRLTVRAGDRLFRDYLNWLHLDGEWRVIAKIFRVEEGPAI